MRIILASASPRRKELLAQIGLQFEVLVSDVEEVVTSTEPAVMVEELSEKKARAVYELVTKENSQEKEPIMVIGADTLVAWEGKVLGKPKDVSDAVAMLKNLQGHVHQVYTGVTILYGFPGEDSDTMQQKSFHETTQVEFFPMTDEEILDYVNTLDPMDKAGAYGIQGLCARYIKGIQGDYNNVVGLPVGRLYQEAKEFYK